MANFNSTTPAAPGSAQNVVFQSSGTNISGYLPIMVGDSGSGGKSGAVPKPAAGDASAGKYLRADGSWAAPPTTGGATGPTGPAGTAATVTVGTTTTGAAGSSASVTNSGSSSAAVLNFTIPQGATGATGSTGPAGTSVQAFTAVAHQWINAISASGFASSTQPAFSDISGTVATGQLPTTIAQNTLFGNGLAVSAFGAAPGSTNGAIELGYDGTQCVIQAYNRSGSTYKPLWFSASVIQFFISNSEKGRFSSAGNLLVGGTSDNGIDKVQVVGSLTAGGLKSSGGLVLTRVKKTAAYTLTANDYTVNADASAGAFTLALNASPVDGQVYEITKTDSGANAVTVSGNGKLISGVSTKTLTTQWQTLRFQYDSDLGGYIAK